jgi:hypothetical protein
VKSLSYSFIHVLNQYKNCIGAIKKKIDIVFFGKTKWFLGNIFAILKLIKRCGCV